jgi:hypothetical protein
LNPHFLSTKSHFLVVTTGKICHLPWMFSQNFPLIRLHRGVNQCQRLLPLPSFLAATDDGTEAHHVLSHHGKHKAIDF